eukprot:5231021-Amphidinium_carterae.1
MHLPNISLRALVVSARCRKLQYTSCEMRSSTDAAHVPGTTRKVIRQISSLGKSWCMTVAAPHN